jgi:hypothetical protein
MLATEWLWKKSEWNAYVALVVLLAAVGVLLDLAVACEAVRIDSL